MQFDERLYVTSTSIRSVHEILWFPITKINVVTTATPHPVAIYRGSRCCSIAGWTVIACKRVEATSACNTSQHGWILNRGFAWLHFKSRHNLMLFSHPFIHSITHSLTHSLNHSLTQSPTHSIVYHDKAQAFPSSVDSYFAGKNFLLYWILKDLTINKTRLCLLGYFGLGLDYNRESSNEEWTFGPHNRCVISWAAGILAISLKSTAPRALLFWNSKPVIKSSLELPRLISVPKATFIWDNFYIYSI